MQTLTRCLGSMLAIGLLSACPAEYETFPTQPEFNNGGRFSGTHALGNDTGRDVVVRIRPLRADLQLNCPTVTQGDPSTALTRDMFAPAQAWLLDAGAVMSLPVNHACGFIALVDGTDLPMRLWVAPTRSTQQFSVDASQLVASESFILNEDGSGGVRVNDTSWLHPAPSRAPVAPTDQCGAGELGDSITWSGAPSGRWRIEEVTTAPDGCSAHELSGENDPEWTVRWYACSPAPLPFEAGEIVHFEDRPNGEAILSDRVEVRLIDGPADGRVTGQPVSACGAFHDICGNLARAIDVTVTGGDGERIPVEVGEPIELSEGHTFILARAERLEIVDPSCGRARTPGDRFQYMEILNRMER